MRNFLGTRLDRETEEGENSMKTRRGCETCGCGDLTADSLIGPMQAEDVDAETGPKQGPPVSVQPLRSRRDYGASCRCKTADLTLSDRDKAVLEAVVDGEEAESGKLSTDGKTLDGNWMGGRGLAVRSSGSNITPGKDRPHVKADEVVLRALKKVTPSRYYKGSEKKAATMSFEDYWKWMDDLKVGDDVMLYWTAGSFGHYKARAKLVRVNPKSVAGKLEEDVMDGSGLRPGEVAYPIGHVIVVPKSMLDRRHSAFFFAPMPIGVDRIAPAGRSAGMCPCGCGGQCNNSAGGGSMGQIAPLEEHLDDEWLTYNEVASVCSSCADKMKKAGIQRVRKSFFMEAVKDVSIKTEVANIRASVRMSPLDLQPEGSSSASAWVKCRECGKKMNWNQAAKDGWMANLGGKSYEDYYCKECARKISQTR